MQHAFLKYIPFSSPIDGFEYGIQLGNDGKTVYRKEVATGKIQYTTVKKKDLYPPPQDDEWDYTAGPKYKWKDLKL